LILPATTQGELTSDNGNTSSTTHPEAARLAELCRQAEAAGADSLWATDHLFWPHPIDEPMTTLAVAAAATSRATLGTCVLQLPLRQPAAVAKQAAALQLLSGGRFVLGLGVGSHPEEYERAGVDFHRRGRLMDEGVSRLHSAWWGDPARPSDYGQEPAAPRVPVWFGGSSPAARRRAAAEGDGWVPLFVTPDDYEPALAALRDEATVAGRDPGEVEPGVVVFVCVGDGADITARGMAWLSDLYRVPPKAFTRHLVSGSAAECAAGLWRYVEAGAHQVIVMVAGAPSLDHFRALRVAFDGETERRHGAALAGVGQA
jgi:alkanesulfonate monooxygenase SsuD/methylene tetrahydromethanopterin reductase-like flavin-dependent oxidoreductase (luciferase family)